MRELGPKGGTRGGWPFVPLRARFRWPHSAKMAASRADDRENLSPPLRAGHRLAAGNARPSGEPSQQAARLAEGISVAFNGVAFGLLFTVVAGVCTACCLILALVLEAKPRS